MVNVGYVGMHVTKHLTVIIHVFFSKDEFYCLQRYVAYEMYLHAYVLKGYEKWLELFKHH